MHSFIRPRQLSDNRYQLEAIGKGRKVESELEGEGEQKETRGQASTEAWMRGPEEVDQDDENELDVDP
eukprot:5400429-Karenia_brevis.AAC.1